MSKPTRQTLWHLADATLELRAHGLDLTRGQSAVLAPGPDDRARGFEHVLVGLAQVHRQCDHGAVVGIAARLDVDGFRGHEGVVVMGATNHVGKIDAAIRRPGRFDTVVTLGYPDHTLMPKAIRWQLGNELPDADLSGAAIAAVVHGELRSEY